MLNKIIAVYSIVDDLLKAIAKRCRLRQFGHDEDVRRGMSDAEIITTSLTAAMFFHGNHSVACAYMKDHKLIAVDVRKITI